MERAFERLLETMTPDEADAFAESLRDAIQEGLARGATEALLDRLTAKGRRK